jgi:hypothetical protein
VLRRGVFDFSPIAALLTLLVTGQIIGLFSVAGKVTFGMILIVIILGIWEAVRMLLIFFLFLCIIRLLGIFFHNGPFRRFLNIIDLALQPFISFIIKVTHRELNYQTLLFLCIGFLAVICIAGSFSFHSLYRILNRI